MSEDGIDLASLPELKISTETFEAIGEISGEELPPEKNGSTWKRRIMHEDGTHSFVLCRYRTQGIGNPFTIEMLRPVITGPVANADFTKAMRKRR